MLRDQERRERICTLRRVERARSQSRRARDERIRSDNVPSEMLGGDDVNPAREPYLAQVETEFCRRRLGWRLRLGVLTRFIFEPPLVVWNYFLACHFSALCALAIARAARCQRRRAEKLMHPKCNLHLSEPPTRLCWKIRVTRQCPSSK